MNLYSSKIKTILLKHCEIDTIDTTASSLVDSPSHFQ